MCFILTFRIYRLSSKHSHELELNYLIDAKINNSFIESELSLKFSNLRNQTSPKYDVIQKSKVPHSVALYQQEHLVLLHLEEQPVPKDVIGTRTSFPDHNPMRLSSM